LGVVIRRALVDESDKVAAIHRLSRETALPFLPVLHTPDEDRQYFRTGVFPACEVWIVEDGAPLGFIAFHEGWVDHLYIHPDHIRRGYGRALLNEAKTHYSELQLWTFQKNLGAIAFYEANGFELVRKTAGEKNQEHERDALYAWSR
jgi:putative acetyltransferase